MADHELTLKDVDIKDVKKDIVIALYMLHHLEEGAFSKEQIRNVAFTLKVTLNSIEKLKKH